MSMLSRETAEQAGRSIRAAEVFRANIQAIEQACAVAEEGQMVVAVVGRDLAFGGVWIVPLDELRERVLQLEGGGWSLVFSPQTAPEDIEERCARMAWLAQAKIEAIQRWIGRQM
jgi:ABC-type uncharacterized transport system ATPase subunit